MRPPPGVGSSHIRPTLRFDQGAREREAEAGAPRVPRPGGVGPEEAFERAVMRLGRHPLTVIFDRDDGFARTVDAPTDLSRPATVSGDVLEYRIQGAPRARCGRRGRAGTRRRVRSRWLPCAVVLRWTADRQVAARSIGLRSSWSWPRSARASWRSRWESPVR